MNIKRYLFELVIYCADQGVASVSEWVTDEWLIDQIRVEPHLDRIVEFALTGPHELPEQPNFILI